MFELPFDWIDLGLLLVAALFAGFTTGFAGFGTGLVASGLWFHVLPAAYVPPLVALASVAGQLVGLLILRRSFDWPRAKPFLMGGILGVPFGVGALAVASPGLLRLSVGVFLIFYALFQLFARWQGKVGDKGGKAADGLVGAGGGFLGGFAGLSGPLPLIWLQLRGGPSDRQRAIYQPFNLLILSISSFAMALAGQIGEVVLALAVICLPATVIGAWVGTRVYIGVSETTFQRVVLCLLFLSGTILIAQILS